MRFHDLSPRPGKEWDPQILWEMLTKHTHDGDGSPTLDQLDLYNKTQIDDKIKEYPQAMGSNGIHDRSNWTCTWDNANRKVVFITPEDPWIWIFGRLFQVWPAFPGPNPPSPFPGPLEPEEEIPDVQGFHIIYFKWDPDTDELTLETLTNPSHAQVEDVIMNQAIAAAVYWDGTTGQLMDELHGVDASRSLHRMLHETFGMQFAGHIDPVTIPSFPTSGATDADAQFGNIAGEVYDEDIGHTIEAVTSTVGYPIWYLNGGIWNWDAANGFPVKRYGTGRLAYNNPTLGTQVEVSNGKFVLAHGFATNFKTDAGADMGPIMIQGQAEYSSLSAAREGAETEINNLVTTYLQTPEMKPLYTFIYRTNNSYGNTVKAKIARTAGGGDYVDHRHSQASGSTGVGLSINHQDLVGAGAYTHADIDLHLASTANPHSVDEDDILPSQATHSGKFLTTDGSNSSWGVPAGSGDVVGPGSSVDNAVARFNLTTGKLIQESAGVLIDDSGNIIVPGTVDGVDVAALSTTVGGNTTAIGLNTTHRGSAGTDHSDVGLNNTHRGSDGKNHSDVVLNNTHRASDGKNHSDVVLNNTHRGLTNNPHSVDEDDVLPTQATHGGKYLTTDGSNSSWATVSGSGDVVGPGSSTDNAVARFHLTTGKIIQESAGVLIDDSGNITVPGTVDGVDIASFYSFGAAHMSNDDKHRTIADGDVGATDLWSGEYINTQLGGKSATGHTHVEADVTDLDHDAVKLQGKAITLGALADKQFLTYTSGTTDWRNTYKVNDGGTAATDIWTGSGDAGKIG